MKKLLNTLYITTPEAYAALDGENIVVLKDDATIGRVPLHNLEAVVCMNYTGASPALMGKCAEENIALSFLKPSGAFLAKVTGKAYGNILLRREQYRIADDVQRSLSIASYFLSGKLYNAKSVLDRAARDYPLRLDVGALKRAADFLKSSLDRVGSARSAESLRGIEGESAAVYFGVFDSLILQQKEDFQFDGRNKRPPTDKVNAMLSFAYILLTGMCSAALETVGLDPYAGFLHTDRPGRCSLALDLMEELRAPFADRFVLTLINKKLVSAGGFTEKESGAVLMDDDTRKAFFLAWQERKQEQITHPFLGEKIEWGLVPYVQALLLARYVRGDLDAYPPFMWK